VKTAQVLGSSGRHEIFCYISDKDSGSKKLTFMYDASLKSYQKTDGVLRPGVPFRACLPTKLGT
jgi:hypothetical protein